MLLMAVWREVGVPLKVGLRSVMKLENAVFECGSRNPKPVFPVRAGADLVVFPSFCVAGLPRVGDAERAIGSRGTIDSKMKPLEEFPPRIWPNRQIYRM